MPDSCRIDSASARVLGASDGPTMRLVLVRGGWDLSSLSADPAARVSLDVLLNLCVSTGGWADYSWVLPSLRIRVQA